MARRLGVLTPRPAEDSEDVLDRSEPTSPHMKSRSYPHLTVCLLLAVGALSLIDLFLPAFPSTSSSSVLDATVVVFVVFSALGNAGFYYKHPEEPKWIRRADFGAIEEELSVHRADDGDESFSDFLASKDGDLSSRPECRAKICEAIPILQEVYGKILHRTLHIGPGTCGVVSKLLKEEDVEVWGIQPFDMRDPIHPLCENFVRKGIIRISDPYKPLPYRKKSFSLVLVTGTLDQMKAKELNRTLLELASVSSHSLMLVVGNGLQRPRRTDIGKTQKLLKPRNRMWWQRRLAMLGLKEDAEHSKRFEILQSERSFKTTSNIFHLHAPGSGEDI